MEQLNAINDTYKAMKADANNTCDILQKAKKAIIATYPDIESNNTNAWNALKDKAIIKQFFIDYVVADYANEKTLELETAQKQVEKVMHDFFNNIKGNPNEGGKNLFDNYLQEIHNHDITNDFQLSLFPANNSLKAINFPKSTLSFIAGRPSAGKTTALASIAMFAMRKTSKKVLFITSEETPQQLVTRFIKNQFCDNCLNDKNKGNLLSHDYGKNYINNVFKDIIEKEYFKNPALFDEGKQKDQFTTEVLKATKEVQQYIESERLQIFNLDKTTSFDELKDVLQEQTRHTIIIIDYIQNLPYAPKNENGTTSNDRLETIRNEVFTINQIVKVNELIGIAGAQFNRQGADEHNPESLELNKLGESGEIERKAHIAIGLGRKIHDDNTKQYFYRVMKDREGDTSAHFELADYYAYSYTYAKLVDDKLAPFYTSESKQSKSGKKTTSQGTTPATESTGTIRRKGVEQLTI